MLSTSGAAANHQSVTMYLVRVRPKVRARVKGQGSGASSQGLDGDHVRVIRLQLLALLSTRVEIRRAHAQHPPPVPLADGVARVAPGRAAPRVHRGPLGGGDRIARAAVLGERDVARVEAGEQDGRGDDEVVPHDEDEPVGEGGLPLVPPQQPHRARDRERLRAHLLGVQRQLVEAGAQVRRVRAVEHLGELGVPRVHEDVDAAGRLVGTHDVLDVRRAAHLDEPWAALVPAPECCARRPEDGAEHAVHDERKGPLLRRRCSDRHGSRGRH